MPIMGKLGTLGREEKGGILLHPIHEKLPVTLAASCRDAVGGHTPTTYLREGLVLVKITSGLDKGKYKHFDSSATDGSEDSSTAIILTADHNMDTTEGYEVTGYFKGTFNQARILVGAGFAYEDVQRLVFRNDAAVGN